MNATAPNLHVVQDGEQVQPNYGTLETLLADNAVEKRDYTQYVDIHLGILARQAFIGEDGKIKESLKDDDLTKYFVDLSEKLLQYSCDYIDTDMDKEVLENLQAYLKKPESLDKNKQRQAQMTLERIQALTGFDVMRTKYAMEQNEEGMKYGITHQIAKIISEGGGERLDKDLQLATTMNVTKDNYGDLAKEVEALGKPFKKTYKADQLDSVEKVVKEYIGLTETYGNNPGVLNQYIQ